MVYNWNQSIRVFNSIPPRGRFVLESVKAIQATIVASTWLAFTLHEMIGLKAGIALNPLPTENLLRLNGSHRLERTGWDRIVAQQFDQQSPLELEMAATSIMRPFIVRYFATLTLRLQSCPALACVASWRPDAESWIERTAALREIISAASFSQHAMLNDCRLSIKPYTVVWWADDWQQLLEKKAVQQNDRRTFHFSLSFTFACDVPLRKIVPLMTSQTSKLRLPGPGEWVR